MKKSTMVFLLILTIFLCLFLTGCTDGEENPLREISPLSSTLHSLPFFQAKLEEKPLALDKLTPYLSSREGLTQKVNQSPYSQVEITANGSYLNPSAFNLADTQGQGFPPSYQPLILAVKEALEAIGWAPAAAPFLFLSAWEAHSIFEKAFLPFSPSLSQYLEDKGIPQAFANTTYLCVFPQEIQGFPLFHTIYQGNNDQFASLYACLWVDEEGKILSGTIHSPYQIVKENPVTQELITMEEAQNLVLLSIEENDKAYESFYQENHLSLSYEVLEVFPCLVVNSHLVAMPGWQVLEHTAYTNTQTGQISHSYWDTAINALTGE